MSTVIVLGTDIKLDPFVAAKTKSTMGFSVLLLAESLK